MNFFGNVDLPRTFGISKTAVVLSEERTTAVFAVNIAKSAQDSGRVRTEVRRERMRAMVCGVFSNS